MRREMKKTILITIICFWVTCLVHAQEVDSLLSINNTLWELTFVSIKARIGFYQGDVYYLARDNSSEKADGFCIDLFGVGVFGHVLDLPYSNTLCIGALFPVVALGIWCTLGWCFHPCWPMVKLSDDWTPLEKEL